MKHTVFARLKAMTERLAAVLKLKPPVVLTLLKALLLCALCGVLFVLSIFIVSGAIVDREAESIYPYAEGNNPVAEEAKYDCILVLGCGVRADGSPTDRLYDRVTVGVHRTDGGAEYANPVEFGHGGPHPAPAHPFVRPAFDAAKDEAYEKVKQDLQTALEARGLL